eukprot:superscaffoldBa00002377_g14067
MRLKDSLLNLFRRRPPSVCALCAQHRGRKVAWSASGEEVPYPRHQKALGRGPVVTDRESRRGRWEIMLWSKTTSSGNRVSAGIAVHILGHTEPHCHRRDPTFHWITGLRPHWPLCRYPVTNLPALTSIQSNDAARPTSRLGFALRHSNQSKSGTAGCSWEQGEKMGGKWQGSRGRVEGGEDGGRAIWKGGQETESIVVERGHSTAVAWEDSLFWENLTQRNKGFVVMSSV